MAAKSESWLTFAFILIGTFLSVLGIGSFSTWLESGSPSFSDPTFIVGTLMLFLGLGLLIYSADKYLE